MANDRPKRSSEHGAVLVHTALALLALMAFSVFAIDFGVLWTARRQAQNAADAGALAGAIAVALDGAPATDNGVAEQNATTIALSNLVWGQAPSVLPADVTFPPCPENPTKTCIRVEVFRNAARGNPLPMFFGHLIGLTQQDIQAVAVAEVAAANATECLKPWALADKWAENNPIVGGTWTSTSTFDPTGPNPDVYVPQNGTSPGTGFTLAVDHGVVLTLKVGRPHDTINPGWFQPLDFPDGGNGGDGYRQDIAGCTSGVVKIGDDVPKENGNMIGPTAQGVQDLIDLDPTADWDPTANGGAGAVVNSCVNNPPCPGGQTYASSPRIVPVPVFDLALYLATGGPGNGTIRVVNILGFFVDQMNGNDVVGVLMTKPDLFVSAGGGVAESAAFVKVVRLVR